MCSPRDLRIASSDSPEVGGFSGCKRIFENRVLRRLFGPKRDATGEWLRVHNEELHTLYRIVRVIKSRRFRWVGHVARMEEGRSAFKMLAGKTTGKRPLGRPRCRWEDKIRMYLK